MASNFEDYPPEFDLDARDLQRYGITKIWAAFHNLDLRPAVYSEWRSGTRSFPAWVTQQVYAQRRARHTPSRVGLGSTQRPNWRIQYADELVASPALFKALSSCRGDLGDVFRLAGLSNQEYAVMRRLFDGMDPSEVIGELQMTWNTYKKTRFRAVAKLRVAFATQYRFIDEGLTNPETAA